MGIVALIPARSGSRRVKNKNIRNLGGYPLVAWTIVSALKSGMFSDVVVSTDSREIAEISERFGASVPWLRSDEASTDESSMLDVVKEFAERYSYSDKPIDAIAILQPTSPFRSIESIKSGVGEFLGSGSTSVIGVCSSETHPFWSFEEDQGYLLPLFPEGLKMRSQDLPKSYVVNGAFYIISTAALATENTLFTRKLKPLVMPALEGTDIDTVEDFEGAEVIVSNSPSLLKLFD